MAGSHVYNEWRALAEIQEKPRAGKEGQVAGLEILTEIGAHCPPGISKVISTVESSLTFKNELSFICLLQIILLRPVFILPQQMELVFSGQCIRSLLMCLRPSDLIYLKET